MRDWSARASSAVALLVWLVATAIAFGERFALGVAVVLYGALYFASGLAIPRTSEQVGVRLLALRRIATGLLFLAIGLWRVGWDDVILFPLAAIELAWGIAFLWVSPRLPRP
jgi:hypothetical protein